MNRALRLEEASLRDPERIDVMARKLGLQSPQPGQVHAHGRRHRRSGAGDGQRDSGCGGVGAVDAVLSSQVSGLSNGRSPSPAIFHCDSSEPLRDSED